jgi:glycosyltransferase involved in cell wall biosynthesis
MQVSVVVPTYNHGAYVEQCLQSIARQTLPPSQVVIIDDGSSDSTWDLVTKFAFPKNISVIRKRTANQGAHAALNLGLDLATGDIIALCNSDDAFAPQRLELMVSAMQRTGSEFSFSRCEYVDDNGRDITQATPYAADLWKKQANISSFASVGFSLLHTNVTISTGNFVFTRSLQSKLGYFRPYRYCHDWDFALRALLVTEPLYVSRTLYRYRIHATNSFAALAHVADVECPELMRRYMKAAVKSTPLNPVAPSPSRWPVYFETQIENMGLAAYMVGHAEIDRPAFTPQPGNEGRPPSTVRVQP